MALDTVNSAFSMPLGDVATWFSGIASAAAVITAVCIALAGNSKERRERKSRARLVAAYLYNPFARVHSLMKDAQHDFAKYVRILDGTASREVTENTVRLKGMCIETRSLLSKFNVADAAALPGPIGEKLADALGEIHMVIDLIDKSTHTYENANLVQHSDRGRFNAAHDIGFLEPLFEQAILDLGHFIDYCRKEFGISS